MAVFESEKSSTDIVNNGTMTDDEVVASDVPRGTCFYFVNQCIEGLKESRKKRLFVSRHFGRVLFKDDRGKPLKRSEYLWKL